MPRAADLPPGVDLAIVAVPAARCSGGPRLYGRQGVRALVVLSAGFGEAGSAGAPGRSRLLEICRAAGMRLVGPTASASSTPTRTSR